MGVGVAGTRIAWVGGPCTDVGRPPCGQRVRGTRGCGAGGLADRRLGHGPQERSVGRLLVRQRRARPRSREAVSASGRALAAHAASMAMRGSSGSTRSSAPARSPPPRASMSASSARTAARSIGSSLSRGSNSRSSSKSAESSRSASRRRGRRCPPGRRRARRGRRPWSRRRLLGRGMRAHRRYRRPPDLPPTPPEACSGRSGPDGRRRRRAVPGSARLPSSRPTPGATPCVVRAARTVTQNCPCALPRLCEARTVPTLPDASGHPDGGPASRPGPDGAALGRTGTPWTRERRGYPAGRVLSVHPEQ